ncbi:AAA family ATPase [Nocardia carnea]|uniref:AAA family ATPase n=1 Tax=Nocardia carnea TaxID=37328 RepID=UPI0024576604|nr:MinD/ParA family protein [Nocardia carnea]
MNRAPTTNGDASAALAKGGYDAYFAQLEEPPAGGSAPAVASPSGAAVSDGPAMSEPPPPGPGPGPVSPADAGPTSPQNVAPPQPGAASSAVSAPAPQPAAAASADTGVTDGELAELRRRAADAHQQAAEAERQAIAQRQQQAMPSAGPAPASSAAGGPHQLSAAETGPGSVQPDAGVAPPVSAPSPSYSAHPNPAVPPGAHSGYGAAPGPTPAHYAADPSRVPDRINRQAYETTGRIEVLPPALASAELLAEIAAVRQAHLRSNKGVRGALNKVGFNLGLSPAEQRAESRRTRIRRQLTAPYQVAVVSVKGGVGRTTTAAGLGSTFAKLRPDRVVAVDANPDFGDLSSRTARHQYGLTLRDLAAAGDRLDSFSAVHSYTAVNTADLAVIASPWNTDAGEALTGDEYRRGVQILRRHYNLLVVDCGTGVLDSSTNSVLHTSDAVVVVTPATVGGVTGAVATLNWLNSHGFDHLIASSMVAIVRQHPVKPTVDVEAIEKLFASAQRPTVQIPFDPHLAEGSEIDLRMLQRETALAFEDLAAGLADDFPGYLAEPSGGEPGAMR